MYEHSMSIFQSRYAINSTETWEQCAARVVDAVYSSPRQEKHEVEQIIADQKFIPAGRYLANAGRRNIFSNCMALSVDDTRQSWAKLLHDSSLALLLGTGIGIDGSKVRPRGSVISSGGTASGAVSLFQMVNEVGRYVMCGGQRRSALLSQLHWQHPDVQEMIETKRLTPEQQSKREKDYLYSTPLDMTNISIRLDDAFFTALDAGDVYATSVFNSVLDNMLEHSEPGFLVNTGKYSSDILTNACSEYRTNNDREICNLGSINMARIETLEEFKRVVALATMFLIRGRERQELPFEGAVKDRVGLGLMGVHTWLMQRGYKYEAVPELERWMQAYLYMSDWAAQDLSDRLGVMKPTRVRCIAPSGTISQLTGITGDLVTSGIEPMFSAAHIRRWMNNGITEETVIIDPAVYKYYDVVEDSFSLSYDLGRRLRVLAAIQKYVDMAISVTINVSSDANEEGNKGKIKDLVLQYLPRLRGLTMYRDGSRGLSPLTPISLGKALQMKHLDVSEYAQCASGVCGI